MYYSAPNYSSVLIDLQSRTKCTTWRTCLRIWISDLVQILGSGIWISDSDQWFGSGIWISDLNQCCGSGIWINDLDQWLGSMILISDLDQEQWRYIVTEIELCIVVVFTSHTETHKAHLLSYTGHCSNSGSTQLDLLTESCHEDLSRELVTGRSWDESMANLTTAVQVVFINIPPYPVYAMTACSEIRSPVTLHGITPSLWFIHLFYCIYPASCLISAISQHLIVI